MLNIRWRVLVGVLGCLPLPALAYDFPLQNPFEATIAGTPAALQPQDLPAARHIDQTTYRLNLRPAREFSLPDNFWAVRQLPYLLARQHHEAPLIFLVAGTGSHYAASTMDFLKRVFYREGFHVVQLSSPTSYDFMAAASRYATPGISRDDARDLHDVMMAIRAAHPDLPVSEVHLLGYSLGGLQAAFVSALDAERDVFRFRRVLMINPPVNLYAATANLDRLVQAKVPGIATSASFFDNVFNKLAVYFKDRGGVEISDAMLFDFQRSPQRLSDEELAMLIGTVFRFAAADIVFTSDLVSRRGQIVPVDADIGQGTPLTPYFQRALFCNFHCYIQHQLLPHWRRQFSGSNLDDLIHDTSLFALAEHLQQSPHIGAFVNADDLIHSAGELDYLRRVLGDRLTVFPHGGHLGNLSYRENVAAMLAFFRGDRGDADGGAPSGAAVGDATLRLPLTPLAFNDEADLGLFEQSALQALDVSDPLEGWNRRMYHFNQRLDERVLLPVIKFYRFALPSPLRTGVSNVFANLADVGSLVNSVLQLKPQRSLAMTGRVLVNTTVGVAGLWDPATPLGLARHVEDAGQTLGRYGLPAGPYLVLPVLGPTTLRDAGGRVGDFALNETVNFLDNARLRSRFPPLTVLSVINERDSTAFRYGQLNSPFEYEKLRYLVTKARELQVQD